MTKQQFQFWTKNGNLRISEERILTVTNHISECEHRAYTKDEAAQCVTYWSLCHFYAYQDAIQTKNACRTGLLKLAVEIQSQPILVGPKRRLPKPVKNIRPK